MARDELFVNTLVCMYLLNDHFSLVYARLCVKSNRLLLMYLFWLCYVLAAEETATDEYRFELQPFCNFFLRFFHL